MLVYQVSPLREPTFQPSSANAGSLVPWLQGVTEGHWLLGANLMAFLLYTNLTLRFTTSFKNLVRGDQVFAILFYCPNFEHTHRRLQLLRYFYSLL
ncbi:hypothetical protein NUACC26_056120 [Scytonema sp. NUACC26]